MTESINQEHEDVLNFAHSLPSGLTKEQIYVRIHERARAEILGIYHSAGARHVEEIKALHRRLAAETLRADQGWQRYEAANADRNSLRSALPPAAAAAGLPAGWKAVPIEPTPAMLAKFAEYDVFDCVRKHTDAIKMIAESMWSEVLDRAPALPADPVDESQPAALELVPTRDGPAVPKAWAKAVYEGWRAMSGIDKDFAGFMEKYPLFLTLANIQSAFDHERGGPAMRNALAALSAPGPAAQEGWTKNTGEQPVADGVRVELDFATQKGCIGDADEYCWSLKGDGEILRWRIAPAMEAQSHE